MSENIIKRAFYAFLLLGIGTLYFALVLDRPQARHCKAGSTETLFTPCEVRASR